MPDLPVLDSTMHYHDSGEGDPFVLLHGNPTSSFLWRTVIPELTGAFRCVAPDLVGMGRSGKPSMDYRFVDHARYLDAFFDVLELDRVTIVGHDWGGALGFDWAARHPERVAALVFMETIVRTMSWDDFPVEARGMFEAFRRPGEGEQLVLDQNLFIEGLLPGSMLHTLTDTEWATYREPYLQRADRLPMLMWPREIPIDGTPEDVSRRVDAYSRWLQTSVTVPKLLLTFDPGAVMQPPLVSWCREHLAALTVRHIGAGIHFVQEDQGAAIGAAIVEWRATAALK